MNVEGAPSSIPAGSMLVMRPGARHDVRAIGPSAFLPQIPSPQPAA